MSVSEMHGMRSPRIVIGPPVRGPDLWDRDREIQEIWKALETGSVLVSAPRRFGKTSVMLSLVDAPRAGWQAYYLDVEGLKGPEDFVAEVIATLLQDKQLGKLLSKIKRMIGNMGVRIEEIEIADLKISLRQSLKKDWQDKGKELIAQLWGVSQRTILVVDELPLLILQIARGKGQKCAAEFLFWLRSLRQTPDLHDKVRWVIGGSIGMEKVLQRVGAGTKAINDLYIVRLNAFSRNVAQDFITALLQNEGKIEPLSPQLLEKFLQIVGVPIPYFLQILVRESLNEMERQGQQSLTEEIVEKAYKNGVLASYNRTYFEHYYERLEHYYGGKLAEIAKDLLSQIARQGCSSRKELWNAYMHRTQGKGDEAEFSYLLSDLENDFYIVHDGDQYSFATKVLRDWWYRFHVT